MNKMHYLQCIFLVIISNFFSIHSDDNLLLRDNTNCTVIEFADVTNATLYCKNIVISNLYIPAGETLELDLQDGATVSFRGNNTFGYMNWAGPLIRVYGNEITLQGEEGHILNGSGELYWDGQGSWGSAKPKFMIIEANRSIVKNLHFYHAPMHGISINHSDEVIFTDIVIDNAAGAEGVALNGHEGHNTDGFGVNMSTNIIIQNSAVYNQDDCVALNSGSNISVANMLCHGSHGLSISVGFSNDSIERNSLSNVLIENATIIDALTGIHIKTHIDAGEGLLSNVTYRNILMIGSYMYGISIEQNYTNQESMDGSGAIPKDNIPIKNLRIENVRGTVLNTSLPYYIVCATGACEDWQWDGIFVSGQRDSACVNFHPDGIDCVDYTV